MTSPRLTPFVPALLAALFAGWCGTFPGAAGWPASSAGVALAAAVVAGLGAPWRDPLRLGRLGALLPLAWVAAVLVSLAASPVPRAGWMGAVLAPLFLCLPAAVARCWRSARDLSLGPSAVAAVVAAVAAWSLADWLVLGAPRPAMPLGHHNLLAAWLVTLAPLALVPLAERGARRALGLASLGLAVAAVVASRSLAGAAGLAVQAALAAVFLSRRRSVRIAVAGLLLAVVATQAPRLVEIAGAEDLSVRARLAYLRAGRDAWLARPVLGWGPGSTPWVVAAFWKPEAGVNPPGEAVGDLHSLPVQLAAELGSVGFLLAALVAVAFVARRLLRRPEPAHPGLRRAALLGLAGAGAVSLANAAYAVTALPVAVAVVLGAALAAEGEPEPRASPGPVRWLAAVCLALLAPLEIARFHYDRAVAGSDSRRSRSHLERAVAWDPAFPLYRFRRALLLAPADRTAAAEEAHRAARLAEAVPLLWTAAGALGASAGSPWARDALGAACWTSPDQPLAHFYLMTLGPTDRRAPLHGARALLAEPRLAAATFWRRAPLLFARSQAEVLALPGLDPAWRQAFAQRAAVPPVPTAGEGLFLELAFDTSASESVSLFVFRRRPWPVRWPLVALDASATERWDLGPAPTVADLGRYPCEMPQGFAGDQLLGGRVRRR